MSDPNLALTAVPDEQLKLLLRALHRGVVDVPLGAPGLAMCGLQDYSEPLLGLLRGLDGPAIKAVIVAVIAERQARSTR